VISSTDRLNVDVWTDTENKFPLMLGVLIYKESEMNMFVVIPVTLEHTGWNSVNINERYVTQISTAPVN